MDDLVTLSSNLTLDDSAPVEGRSVAKWTLVILLWLTSMVTFFGNLLVILAFVFDRKLFKINFNIYILNLAITDVMVSTTAIPFYSIDFYLGYWPFNEITCAFWIFCDWGMTFASIFILVAISVDRYWAASWPNNYRKHNTSKKRTVISNIVVWICLVIMWVPPWIIDRIRWSSPGTCIWAVDNNREFVIFVAICGYHGPSIIMIFCYIKVFMVMQKSASAFKTKVKPAKAAPSESTQVTTISDGKVDGEGVSAAGGKEPVKAAAPAPPAKKQDSSAKERRIFISLSYIIIAYLICWSPFHIVFDVLFFDPNAVSFEWYTFAAWMCYINSMLNPILYAASSKDFRSAFKHILTLRCILKK